MKSIFDEWAEFEEKANDVLGCWEIDRNSGIDYEAYITQLNEMAHKALCLTSEYRVSFKGVYLRKTNIHTLIYRVDYHGKRYSAGITRRMSLGMRDQAGERWKSQLRKAHDIAMGQSPVALSPELETLTSWKSSNRNKSKMTFAHGQATLVLNASKVVHASGNNTDLVYILTELSSKGL